MKLHYLLSLVYFIYTVNIFSQVAEIPMDIEPGGHTFVKVKVNDLKRELDFVFDTGATADLIDKKIADEIGIKGNYQQKVDGASGVETYDIALNQTLLLNNKIKFDHNNLVLKDLSNLNNVFGKHLDGIIGYSVLSKFITKIDYENNKLVLYKKLKDVDLDGFSKIPFSFNNGIPIPQFNISYTLTNGEKFTGPILFDSGAGLTLLVNTPFVNKNNIRNKAGKSIRNESEGLGSSSISEIIKIKSLTIGNHTFKNLTVSLSNSDGGVTAMPEFMGIMGAKIIKRFTIVLDYEKKELYLKPNKHYAEDFKFPLTGIKLKKGGGKIKVAGIDKTTPAYKKGLRVGDQILKINGNKRSLSEYNKLLTKKGSKVLIECLNTKGEKKVISLMLENLL
ncbi:aspartyl protease family protein [Tenacibaculum xiamenense]|uniref:aspartyl protease family protein n=1 Tax=Tenacibaculum xiamenense TaxID=1261553 RepID=UPI003892DEDA